MRRSAPRSGLVFRGKKGVSVRKLASACVALAASMAVGAHSLFAAPVFYDGTLGTLADDQGWIGFIPFTPGASQTLHPTSLTMNTSSSLGEVAGLFRNAGGPLDAGWPNFNAASGYTLRFDVRIDAESHASVNRAGFSVLIVGATPSESIELGFWTDRIWAQNGGASPTLFTQGEGVAFNAAAAIVRYDLAVSAGSYSLYGNGALVLSGALRDYTLFDPVASGVPFSPYIVPNFLFLGDNTRSASATTTVSRVEFIPQVVPTPGVAVVLGGMVAIAGRRRRGSVVRGG